jgi:hypothetical protein
MPESVYSIKLSWIFPGSNLYLFKCFESLYKNFFKITVNMNWGGARLDPRNYDRDGVGTIILELISEPN